MTFEDTCSYLEISLRTGQRYQSGERELKGLALRALKQAVARRCAPIEASRPAFRFIDLFAGIGGLRMGFETIG
ncbi:DNA (cytosine-5-)-methyltransferase, partial [Variovorax sp. 2RAF20]